MIPRFKVYTGMTLYARCSALHSYRNTAPMKFRQVEFGSDNMAKQQRCTLIWKVKNQRVLLYFVRFISFHNFSDVLAVQVSRRRSLHWCTLEKVVVNVFDFVVHQFNIRVIVFKVFSCSHISWKANNSQCSVAEFSLKMDTHILLACVVFAVHVFQVQSRTFTDEDCPGE